MKKKRWVWLLTLVAMLVLFTSFVIGRGQKTSKARQRLPDGSYLQLCSVQCSKGSHSYNAPNASITGLRAKVAKVLPQDLRARLNWLPFGGGAMTVPGGIETNLAAFTIFEGSTNSRYRVLRLVVSDGVGTSFDAGAARGFAISTDGKYQYQLNGWVIPAFTNYQPNLRLRYYDWFKTNDCVAEFIVPNPAAANGPVM